MAYTSGTANNYKDLLSVLATFAAANGWAVMEQSETRLYLKGQGLAGLDEIHVGIDAFENTVSGYYNWALEGAISYRAGRLFGEQPGSSGGNNAYAYLWQNPIPYWMVATPRRIIVVAKISTVYQLVHLGLGEPPGTDAQYPYPLVIGGCGKDSANRWSTTGSGNTMFCSAGGQAGRVRLSDGMWGNIVASSGVAVADVFATTLSAAYKGSIISAPGDSYVPEQIWLVEGSRASIVGAIDGLFAISGYKQSAENIVVIGGVNHLVFPNVYRVGYGDYFALRLN